jgi:RNA methyltransferase, TrmH family
VDSLSDKNPLIKQIRRAVAHGTLTDDGYAVAEGPHLLDEAAKAGREIKVVVVAESVESQIAIPAGVALRTVSDKTFRELASTESPQGVIALVRPDSSTLVDLAATKLPLLVILDGIQEPGNAGAILRAAEAFGATGAVFLKGTVNPYNPKCMRASAGSIFRLPLVAGVEPGDLPEIPIYAAIPRAVVSIDGVDLKSGCAIVIGSEGRGVRPELVGRAAAVSIPTRGVESLNAAVAAGVLLYEASRQRALR